MELRYQWLSAVQNRPAIYISRVQQQLCPHLKATSRHFEHVRDAFLLDFDSISDLEGAMSVSSLHASSSSDVKQKALQHFKTAEERAMLLSDVQRLLKAILDKHRPTPQADSPDHPVAHSNPRFLSNRPSSTRQPSHQYASPLSGYASRTSPPQSSLSPQIDDSFRGQNPGHHPDLTTLSSERMLQDQHYDASGQPISGNGIDDPDLPGFPQQQSRTSRISQQAAPFCLSQQTPFLEAACPVRIPFKSRSRSPTASLDQIKLEDVGSADEAWESQQIRLAMKVLRQWPSDQSQLVVFKGGGLPIADMEHVLASCGWTDAVRLTNIIKEADCVLARPEWETGRKVNLDEQSAGAMKQGIPMWLLQRLDARSVAHALSPLLLQRRLLQRHPDAPQVVTVTRGEFLQSLSSTTENRQLSSADSSSDYANAGSGNPRSVISTSADIKHTHNQDPRAGMHRALGKTDEPVTMSSIVEQQQQQQQQQGGEIDAEQLGVEPVSVEDAGSTGRPPVPSELTRLKLRVAQGKLPIHEYARIVKS